MLSSGSDLLKNKKERDERCAIPLAESEGFEPPDQLPGHRISSAARSTTPATFLVKGGPISISPPFINSREEM